MGACYISCVLLEHYDEIHNSFGFACHVYVQ